MQRIKEVKCEIITEDEEQYHEYNCDAPTIDMMIEKAGAIERMLAKQVDPLIEN